MHTRRQFIAQAALAGACIVGVRHDVFGEVAGASRVVLERNVRIPMSDGITLAANLYRPANASGKLPAIIDYTPYRRAAGVPVDGSRTSRQQYFASHGYVVVSVDIRGTGDSEGCNTSPTSPEEVRDNLAVIRWCAQQSWCDGSVGMTGLSYTAGVCFDAARQAPPELKAIIVCQMTSDWYDGIVCPGGSPRLFVWETYAPLMAAYNFAPPDPEALGDKWSEVWKQRLEGSRPWGHAYIENLNDGPFWEARLLHGHETEVKAATMLMGGWCDWYPDDLLRVFSRLQCSKRAIIGPWTHSYPETAWPAPRISDRYECLRWFDKYLKGIDTDPAKPVTKEPPVTVFVRDYTPPAVFRLRDEGAFRNEAQWPPRDGQPELLSLAPQGRLLPQGTESPVGKTSVPYRTDVGVAAGRYAIGQLHPGWGMADDQRLDEPHSLCWTLDRPAPQTHDALVGIPVAILSLASTAKVAFVSVKLCDIAPDGTRVLITKGLLNLTHRNGHAKPAPLEPDKVYRVRIPLQATAYRLQAGHRLRLMIAPADFQNVWPSPEPHTLTIHHGGENSSTLELPWVGPSALPAPDFRPSDFTSTLPSRTTAPKFGIEHDLIAQTTSVRINAAAGAGGNRSVYTVSLERPAEAVVESEFELPYERKGFSFVVKSKCTTRSDAREFHHETTIDITFNGQPHWSKSWKTSVPRVNQ